MKIALLTSNQPRHLYFIKTISKKLKPSLIIIESKKKSYFYKLEKKFFGKKISIPNYPLIKVKRGKINDKKIFRILKKKKVDLCLVFGTSLINEKIFKIPTKGCLNIHTGLVQGFRGTDSCYWAIYKKKPEYVGVTIHQLATGIDNGDVLIQKKTNLNKNDTIEEIFFKTCKIGIELLASIIGKITKKKFNTIPVKLGKNYRSKDMNTKVKLFIDQNIKKIIGKYLANKKIIDKLQEKKGKYLWKL